MNLIEPWAHPNGLLGRLAGWEMARGKDRLNRAVLAALDAAPTDRILEVGFGPGVTLAHLAAALPDAHLAGADPSPVMLAQASRRKVRADLQLAAAESLPFADDAFDRAYTLNSIAHWASVSDGLAELRRVLRPGGVLVVGVRHEGTLAPVIAGLEAAGFAVERVRDQLVSTRIVANSASLAPCSRAPTDFSERR